MFRAIVLFISFSFLFIAPTYSIGHVSYTYQSKGNPGDDPTLATAAEAKAIIQEILDAVGVKTSFEVRAAKIPNAAAAVANGKQYILYNPTFMAAISKVTGSNRWVPIAILAHEIGHHLDGHTATSKVSTPENELEADAFSGFALRKMGASLEDAQLAIRTASSKYATATHPARVDRLDAIAQGWNKADAQLVGNKPVQKQYTRMPEAATVNTNTVPALAEQYIAYDVQFKNDDESRYYVTVRNNLVKLEDNKLYILGKLLSTNSAEYPLALKVDDMLMLVSNTGHIVSRKGVDIGQVKLHNK